jgi:hypothetical protein
LAPVRRASVLEIIIAPFSGWIAAVAAEVYVYA